MSEFDINKTDFDFDLVTVIIGQRYKDAPAAERYYQLRRYWSERGTKDLLRPRRCKEEGLIADRKYIWGVIKYRNKLPQYKNEYLIK